MSWDVVRLGDVCDINPSAKGKLASFSSSMLVSFLPMEAMEAKTGVMKPVDREFAEVRKGYTYFENGDVLFAKITPCMQNGKHAVAQNLTNGIGFGSTEFHVLRPSVEVTSEWIYYLISQKEFLTNAENYFQGAVGQQRLPDDFLKKAEILLPPLDEQRRIAAEIERQLAAVARTEQAAMEQLEAAQKLNAAYLREVFEGNEWDMVWLKDVCEQTIKTISSDESGEMVYIDISSVDNIAKKIITPPIIPIKGAPSRAKQVLMPNDIILSTVRPNLNALAINNIISDKPIVASTGFCVLRCKAKLDYRYLFQFCMSETFIKNLSDIAKGSSYPAVTNTDVFIQTIPLPPLDEQRRIAVEIERQFISVEQAKKAMQYQLDTINAMPAAILRQAFSGQM